MQVRRLYVEKKKGFDVEARAMLHELRHDLLLGGVEDVRVLVRYDVEGISDSLFDEACGCVFAEPPVDMLYRGGFPSDEGDTVFSVEYLPGQFDQRADSAEQCVQFLDEEQRPVIRTAKTFIIKGTLSDSDIRKIKEHCINPVDSRECGEELPETLVMSFPEPDDIEIIDGFRDMDEDGLTAFYDSLGLAMTLRDMQTIQEYFRRDEDRDPTITEIRVLDTYWSDHCRHTTFATELKDIRISGGDYEDVIRGSLGHYLEDRKAMYEGRDDKFVCLMDIATLAAKVLKKEGKLTDQEESDEINACSIIVPVDVDGKEEEWLINFKNETHNHPTEIEPFGGAATCLGGAIRDPLSGRTYVYQAMRVTGAADPNVPVEETLKGKLPQKTLTRGAAKGYSSYGNQIGLATGCVKEIYHPDYVAKRMEIGAVLGAAKRSAVKRESSSPGDPVILLGGRTGRDGIGGATGSSKVHTTESLESCGAEVQKGNAPTERKLQRLFRRPEVSRLIKKCNDFGAGGVSVAIGELADGLDIDLDLVPKKYAGLDGTELAISESQERMAVVVDPADEEEFMRYADEENLEATRVAVVTEDPRLVMKWRGKKIVDLSRRFLDTNGAHQETEAEIVLPDMKDSPMRAQAEGLAWTEEWKKKLSDLNACSQKGLVEMFDSSIGAASVLMPYGGKYQMTETQTMAAKIPVPSGNTDTVSLMSFGFDPYISSWSPYHGAVWAVTESMAKIAASGGDVNKIHFTFQEYFRRMTKPEDWGLPLAALLGAYEAQTRYGLASIGGKDSMSGSFNDINVPPTLVSFAVAMGSLKDMITPEAKKPGDILVRLPLPRDDSDLPEYEKVMELFAAVRDAARSGVIRAAYCADRSGTAVSAAKMLFGNRLGLELSADVSDEDLFSPACGCLILEADPADIDRLPAGCTMMGTIRPEFVISRSGQSIRGEELLAAWDGTLAEVFRTVSGEVPAPCPVSDSGVYIDKAPLVCAHPVGQPEVFMPVFPGTNCEYDSTRAFIEAGARVETRVFRNLDAEAIRESVEVFSRCISKAQIIMFPGGFSAGDEPDGSAKFFATAFRNDSIKEAVLDLINNRDGLVLGVCNGFQALIKLGLLPYGDITGQSEDSPTLTYNTVGRHISKMVYTKVVSNKSPWLALAQPGGVYTNPASHGEGRFAASDAWIEKLLANGQVATRYCDPEGGFSDDEYWNVNGSRFQIEGITSPDGRIYGKMAHVERRGKGVAINITGEQDMQMFRAGVDYFRR